MGLGGLVLGLGLGLRLGTRGEVTFPLSAKMRPEIEELTIVRSPETLLGLGLGLRLPDTLLNTRTLG